MIDCRTTAGFAWGLNNWTVSRFDDAAAHVRLLWP